MYIYKIKIQLDKEEEEETLKQKEKKELHSDCSLYESWPKETYVRTYICTFDRIMIECKATKTLSQQQQEAIRWYNNWHPFIPSLFPYDSI